MASPCWGERQQGPGREPRLGFGSRQLGWAGRPAARSSSAEGGGGLATAAGAAFICHSQKGKCPSLLSPSRSLPTTPRHTQLRGLRSCGLKFATVTAAPGSGTWVVVCTWWRPQLRSDGRLQVRGTRFAFKSLQHTSGPAKLIA